MTNKVIGQASKCDVFFANKSKVFEKNLLVLKMPLNH